MGRITSDGSLTIVGEVSCIDNEVGFSVEMQDTFSAANGDKLTTAITMQLCPIAPGIYHGVGTYLVTGDSPEPPAQECSTAQGISTPARSYAG